MREQSAKKETDSITTMRDNDCSFSNTPVHARSKRLSRVFVTPKEKSKESTPAGLKKITQSDAPTHRQRKSGRRKYWEANSLLDTSSSESEDEKKPRKSSNAREVKKRGGANSQHQEVSSVSTKPEVPRAVRHTRKRLIENPTPLTQTKPKDESHHRNTEGRDNEVERLEMANSDEEIILTQSIRSTREQVKILPEYMESNVEPPLSCRTRRHTLSSMSSTQQHQGKSTNQLEKTKLKRGCERLMMEKVSDSADSSEAPSDSEPVKHKFRRSARRQSIYKPDDRRSTRASSQTPLQVSGRHTPTPQSQTQLRRTPHRKAKSRVQYTSEPDQKSDSDYEGLSDSSDASGDSKDRKHSSKTRTDKGKASQTRHSRLSTFTPSVQERRKPVKERGTVLERARAQLHVSAVPISLPCREEEFANILGYVEGKLESGTGGCLYISGVPGTGKTATVLEVVRHLQQQSDHSLPGFKFIDVNGMRLTQPHQAFVQIYKGLKDKIVTADHATSLLDNIFCKDRRQESIVLLVDELDLLVTRKQEILYNLFDWPTKPKSRLVVLAIANTMDLPERVMMNRVSSRLGLNRMTFQPYTFQQLQEIVHSRLTGISAFDPDAVQLASRKVAAVSGDARRALDICRRSTEVAEADGQELVRMQHVNQALQEMFSSPKITAIRNCSIYEKVMLKALLAEFTRSGIEEATLCQVSRHVNALCSMERVPHIKMMQMMKVCSNLNNIKLILLECNGKGIYQRVRLNVGQDDVQYALREDKS
ncbi:origin recognition complex subunit 1-like [Watersipora subatra]|uniref:origin recognition complex subunit 1-like n=1 Tax=Watersipora subatra TaxID=2589382 RepID=UPI00355C0E78